MFFAEPEHSPTSWPCSRFTKCHATAISLAQLLEAGSQLVAVGIQTRNFAEQATEEPFVIGWMASLSSTFSDPGSHSVAARSSTAHLRSLSA
jgi:hypothetical protein